MNTLDRLFAKQSLLDAWEEHKASFPKRTLSGVDGITRTDFANTIEQQVADISERVRFKAFGFSKLRPIAIPKENGGIRLINVPTIRDRFVQKVLVRFLSEQYGESWKVPSSFSSLKGTGDGVQNSLETVRKLLKPTDFVIRADLSKYFDTIDRPQMREVIKSKVRHRSLHELLFGALACETAIRSGEEKAIFQKAGLKAGCGIRQGMPLSPIFSYLFLLNVDRQVEGGFHRYVDDLLFFGADKLTVESHFQAYRAAVTKRGLRVHEMGTPKEKPKTVLIGPRNNFDFLGIKLVRAGPGAIRFEIPPTSRKRIETEVLEACEIDLGDARKQKNWLLTSANKANNLVRNYRGAYGFCSDWPQFEKTLKQLQLAMCRRIVAQLSHAEKRASADTLLRLFGI
ncbi:MAG: hypothetical protein CME84_04020 [Henriciella sp.]|jgi:hypothetical protein|uniref:reverse transcriptase domain-containing protein n=1 Tax=Henriciella sp. TaxID=1968823 RepID=UPI000C0DB777|nr:reverse transcriptase domain-containing protein [Henriciella sp.]MAN73241.1 hypothetical protein [Henriciella sp.]MBF34579.1 hypothetical protein [Hyphomonadaceae bacterium]PHR81403.1 MAG: hypothetical protein COA64_02670 [Henriciella sp.]|tara:strand:- start:868 stop:2064 length:1197 start_codon:yes stop_codon:yes gene_type:complete